MPRAVIAPMSSVQATKLAMACDLMPKVGESTVTLADVDAGPWEGANGLINYPYPALNQFPSMTAFRAPRKVVVIINGLRGLVDYFNLLATYVTPVMETSDLYANQFLLITARRSLTRLLIDYGLQQDWEFLGWSAGGALAQVMACELVRTGQGAPKYVGACGSPRPGGVALRVMLDSMPNHWVQLYDDRVPTLPPTGRDWVDAPESFAETPAARLTIHAPPSLLRPSWATYLSPTQCTSLTQTGDPSLGGPRTSGRILIPAHPDAELAVVRGPQHDTRKYATALSLYVTRLGTGAVPFLPPVQPAATPIPPILRDDAVLTNEELSALFGVDVVPYDPRGNLPSPVEIQAIVDSLNTVPGPRGVRGMIPKTFEPKVVKVSDTQFTVYLDGDSLASFATRGRAKTWAKKIASVNRYMVDNSTEVSQANFVSAYGQWITDAGNPAKGFVPVLPVV